MTNLSNKAIQDLMEHRHEEVPKTFALVQEIELDYAANRDGVDSVFSHPELLAEAGNFETEAKKVEAGNPWNRTKENIELIKGLEGTVSEITRKNTETFDDQIDQTTKDLYNVDGTTGGFESRQAYGFLDPLQLEMIVEQMDDQVFFALVGKSRPFKKEGGSMAVLPYFSPEVERRQLLRRRPELAERLEGLESKRDSIRSAGKMLISICRRRVGVFTGWENR